MDVNFEVVVPTSSTLNSALAGSLLSSSLSNNANLQSAIDATGSTDVGGVSVTSATSPTAVTVTPLVPVGADDSGDDGGASTSGSTPWGSDLMRYGMTGKSLRGMMVVVLVMTAVVI